MQNGGVSFSTMKILLVSTILVISLTEFVTCQGGGPPSEDDAQKPVKVCTASTPGREWVRRGVHLRRRGECQQGYTCTGNQIVELKKPCKEPSYLSVHTGTCSFPGVYEYVFGSFTCQDEENDDYLNWDIVEAKREGLCLEMIRRADPNVKELYVGDPENCRLMYKCPNVAEHDDWMHRCPPGFRFDNGIDTPACTPDIDGCGRRRT